MPRRRRLTLSLAALALLTTAAAEDLEAEDVPPECAATCAPIVRLTARCEAQTEQRFGDLDKRWDSFSSSRPSPPLRRRRKAKRVSRRQEDDDSDSEAEGAANTAAKAAAEQATRACVCGERGFDVPGVAGACAACVAGNATAVEANEDIKEIMAECGFAVPAAPVVTSTPPVLAPPAAAPIPGFSAPPPAMLAPIEGSSSTSSTSSSTPPPVPPQNTPAEQTPTPPPPPPPPPPTTPSEKTPTPPAPAAPPSSVPGERSITPVTVFETPTFRTLPPIVSPNDFSPSRSDPLSGAAAAAAGPMGGWVRWAIWISVAVLVLR